MDDKQIRIVERLLKKLSALRATLSNDERGVLDHLIVGESGEVQAHALRPASVGAKMPAQDEVQAHMTRPEAGASTARWVSTLHIYWDSEKDEYRHD